MIIDSLNKFNWNSLNRNKNTIKYNGEVVYYSMDCLYIDKRYVTKIIIDNYIIDENIEKELIEKFKIEIEKQQETERQKRRNRNAIKKVIAETQSTYSSFEWRKKVWKEHSLFVCRSLYSAGYFDIYESCNTPIVNEKRKWFKYNGGTYVGRVSIDNLFNDTTVQKVLDKYKSIKLKKVKDAQQRMMNAIEQL